MASAILKLYVSCDRRLKAKRIIYHHKGCVEISSWLPIELIICTVDMVSKLLIYNAGIGFKSNRLQCHSSNVCICEINIYHLQWRIYNVSNLFTCGYLRKCVGHSVS